MSEPPDPVAARFDKVSAAPKFGGNLLAFLLGWEFSQLLS